MEVSQRFYLVDRSVLLNRLAGGLECLWGDRMSGLVVMFDVLYLGGDNLHVKSELGCWVYL